MRNRFVLALLAAAVTLSGCAGMQDNEMFSKENLGTVIGAGAGVLLGSQVGGGDGRKLAMLAGAMAGGYLGKTIGARLDERDRLALAQQTNQVLSGMQDGQSGHWRSEHSDASATITPLATETRTQPATVRRTAKVQQVTNMALLNTSYQTVKGANIRNAPSTSAEKIGSLASGTSFTALGRTDNDWIAVGRQGVNVGYIYAPLTAPVKTAQVDTATDLDSLVVSASNPAHQAFDLDSVVSEQITASTQCRTLRYDVTAAGSTESTEARACQSTDGAWELI